MAKSKKAAFELSVTTIIIIVLAVTFLILGLALLRNIFGGATQSIDDINSALGKEVQKIFADDTKTIIVYLNDKTAKIKAGTLNFNFWISAKTRFANDVKSREDIKYKLQIDKSSDCYKKLGSSIIEKWFEDKVSSKSDVYNAIREYQGDTGYAKINLNVPSGTILCTQTVLVDFVDDTNEERQAIGGTSFTIQILRSGLF